jgi:hypothetical protein
MQAQQDHGGIQSAPLSDSPCWPTGLAMIAWNAMGEDTQQHFDRAIERAAQWLVNIRGRAIPLRPDIFGHNSQLQGWSWVEDTHSWLEPTAYGVLGLRAANKDDHPHTREAVMLLHDRMFPSGGWNYGNTRTLGRVLRPFPGTTGIVLTALAGEHDNTSIEPSFQYLHNELRGVRSPMSLAWGLIGLTECGVRPREAEEWLAESAAEALKRKPQPLEEALLLIADSDRPLIVTQAPHLKERQDNG